MLKLFFSLFLLIFISFSGTLNVAFAQVFEQTKSIEIETEKISTPSSSYEIFWPLVAGKTIDDPLYFIKSLKEQVRGFLIFGTAEKAEYHILLSTKRILEFDQLIRNNKQDLALKTLDLAESNLSLASQYLKTAKDTKKNSQMISTGIGNKINNLEIFIPILHEKNNNDVKLKLNNIKQIIDQIRSSLT